MRRLVSLISWIEVSDSPWEQAEGRITHVTVGEPLSGPFRRSFRNVGA